MNPAETAIQKSFFQICKAYETQDPRYGRIFSIPNGGKRDLLTAITMKREGCKAGALDVFVMVAAGKWHGMFIEFKTKHGRLSKDQKDFAEEATRAGFLVIIARDAEQAFRAVKKYFNRPEYFGGRYEIRTQ